MDEKTITALAREYAEDDNPITAHRTPTERKWDIQTDADSAERVIRFLLRRYALVEKSKIREAYKDAQKDQYNSERDFALTLAGRNRSAVLIDLFPEIAKEVEG